MDKLRSMMVFERVVAENGFAACARKLDISPTAVTRLVGDLERLARCELPPLGHGHSANLRTYAVTHPPQNTKIKQW